MATSYKKLRMLTVEELIEVYDAHTRNTVVGLDFYRNEIARREAQASTDQIVRMTRHMRNLTIVVTVLTLVNVIIAFVR